MASPNFNSRQDVTPGVPEAVSPLIRRVVAGNGGPYTFTGTASYIVGQGNVAIIDPGPDEDGHLAALLDATRGETVTHIIATHTHNDHTALAPKLVAATGALTYGFGPHGSGRPIRLAIAAVGDAGGDVMFSPDVRLADGDTVDGEGWSLTALHTPGHTSNHLSFALDNEKALFSGDHVMGWSTTMVAPPDGHMGDYMASLRRLLRRDEQVYWPGHGGRIEQPARFVRALVSHREAREQAFIKRLRGGDRTIEQIVASIYSELDEKLKRAAALTVLAHMVDLVERGEVEVSGPLGPDAEFRLAD